MKLEVGKFYKTRDGRKVGPMGIEESQDATSFHWNVQGAGVGRWDESGDDGYASTFTAVDDDLVALWQDAPTGPVRTVTRTTKEIVPGVYGAVSVHQITDSADAGHVWITLTSKEATPEQTFHALLKADQIRAAIATLTEIAQALEDQ